MSLLYTVCTLGSIHFITMHSLKCKSPTRTFLRYFSSDLKSHFFSRGHEVNRQNCRAGEKKVAALHLNNPHWEMVPAQVSLPWQPSAFVNVHTSFFSPASSHFHPPVVTLLRWVYLAHRAKRRGLQQRRPICKH